MSYGNNGYLKKKIPAPVAIIPAIAVNLVFLFCLRSSLVILSKASENAFFCSLRLAISLFNEIISNESLVLVMANCLSFSNILSFKFFTSSSNIDDCCALISIFLAALADILILSLSELGFNCACKFRMGNSINNNRNLFISYGIDL